MMRSPKIKLTPIVPTGETNKVDERLKELVCLLMAKHKNAGVDPSDESTKSPPMSEIIFVGVVCALLGALISVIIMTLAGWNIHEEQFTYDVVKSLITEECGRVIADEVMDTFGTEQSEYKFATAYSEFRVIYLTATVNHSSLGDGYMIRFTFYRSAISEKWEIIYWGYL